MIAADLLSVKMLLRCLPERAYCLLLIIWAITAPPGAHSLAAQEAQVFGVVYGLHEMTPLPDVTVSLEPDTMPFGSWQASVAGEDAETMSPLPCTTGPDGGFLFHALSPGTYLLKAQGTGIGLSQEHYVEVVPASGSLGPFHIHTIPGGAIRGKVYNKNTGAGLADISVLANMEGTGDSFRTVTNAEGDYAFENLPPGVCDMYLSCLFRQISHSRQACVRDNQAINAFDFALDIPGTDAGSIAGHVVDCAGDLIVDATVIAQYPVKAPEPHRPARNMAKTDATGRFTMADLDPDIPFTLAALRDGYAFCLENMRPHPEEIIAIELRQEAVITGIVHDESGRPVEKAKVDVWQGATRPTAHILLWPVGNTMAFVSRNGISSETERDGTFRIGGLPAGEYKVEVSYEPAISTFSSVLGKFWPDHAVASASCDLVEGQTLSGLALSLKTADYLSSISGRVLTSDGRPVPGARVRADNARHSGHATADLDGAFTIIRLPHGAYWLNANARGYQDYSSSHQDAPPFERGRIATGGEPVTLVLIESTRVEGRVVDAKTGTPIPVYQIGFGREQEAPVDVAPKTLRTQLEPQGRFSLELNRPETHIVARAEGFATASQALRTSEKTRTHEIVLALSPVPDLEKKARNPEDSICQEAAVK